MNASKALVVLNEAMEILSEENENFAPSSVSQTGVFQIEDQLQQANGVIWHHFHLNNLSFTISRDFSQDILQSAFNPTNKNRSAVLGTPNDVVLTRIHNVAVLSVLCRQISPPQCSIQNISI